MKITDRALIELLARATGGQWKVGSDESYKFYIYREDTSPIRYVLQDVAETTTNYDLRLMALARELGEEVILLRKRLRELSDN